MDRRTLLAVVLTFAVLMLWEAVYMAPRRAEFARRQAAAVAEKRRADSVAALEKAAEPETALETPAASEIETPHVQQMGPFFGEGAESGGEPLVIAISNDVMRVELSSYGGEVKSVVLPNYLKKDGTPVELVPAEAKGGLSAAFLDGGEWRHLGAQFDVFVDGHPVKRDENILLGDDRNSVEVSFRRSGSAGESVEKRYIFTRDSYGAQIRIAIVRAGELARTESYRIGWECGLQPSEKDIRADRAKFAAMGFVGEEYRKVDLSKFGKERFYSFEGTVVWAAARTKYFMSALIATGGGRGSGTLSFSGDRVSGNVGFDIASPFRGDPRIVEEEYIWYAGPLDMKRLRSFGVGMERAIDLGKMRFLSAAILRFMVWMYRWIPNYGVVIIVLSVITKLLFFRLTHKSFKSMKDMQRLQPKIKEIQEKFKNDRDRMNKEIMKAYKEAGVNPLGGCLPLLLQMPVFIALYNALSNTIELRAASFIWWIDDLSMPDTLFHWSSSVPFVGNEFHLLPILMGAAMVMQSRMGGSPTGEGAPAAQTKMMNYMMPVIFTIFFYSMPSGLVLYWLVNQLFSIGQQYIAQKEIEKEEQSLDIGQGAGSDSPNGASVPGQIGSSRAPLGDGGGKKKKGSAH